MNEQEAKEILNDFSRCVTVKADGVYETDDFIKAREMAISALEKQIPKKPIRNDLCTCPSCGTYNETVKKRRNTVNMDIVYCWHCGQAMEIKRGVDHE